MRLLQTFPDWKLEGLATEELLELQSNYSLAYEKNLEDTLSQRNSAHLLMKYLLMLLKQP